MNPKKWTTKDGRKLRIEDMSTEHLKNAIKLLDRALEFRRSEAWAFCGMVTADIASEMAMANAEHLEEADPGKVWPIYDDMVEELEYRNIDSAPHSGGKI